MAATRASYSRCAVAAAARATVAVSSTFLLAAVAACCPSTVERLELLPDMVEKTMVVRGCGGWR
jgi:hypothetical protein